MAKTGDEAAAAYNKLGGKIAVVKAQIHAGGRGKGTIKEQPEAARRATGQKRRRGQQGRRRTARQDLVTIQTGPDGRQSIRCFVEAGCDIARELYLGIVVDRAAACRC